ncbi:hippocampus abundant transcript 1 protein-like isoform X1 [Teleopsis dalmanni]|uniref:hippocampus abundant transcript 1 protein-like isoform X1 n=1 Tax=Teleopsis dalmanni TaxID=139649 RepID=UPI0018CCD39D|nr:hippocampus abundant transcript 1 protein-like isoform X1 [Teleopsis dalmanni]
MSTKPNTTANEENTTNTNTPSDNKIIINTNDEEPTTTSYADDGDTSFEIDEPEDEEVIDVLPIVHVSSKTNNITNTPTTHAGALAVGETDNITETSVAAPTTTILYMRSANSETAGDKIRSYNVPFVSIRDHEPDESTDASIDSDTGSSTPTTADVADLSAVSALTTQKAKRLSPLQNSKIQLNIAGGSITEDNISGSIATETTEIDIDNIPSVSPRVAKRLANSHPTAAIFQSDIPRTGSDEGSGSSSKHKRNLSSSSYRSIGSQHPASLPSVQTLQATNVVFTWLQNVSRLFKSSGIGEPSVYHALVVIFLEFFAWGLLTMPVISVLNQTFPDHTFLMNGLVMGIKGILSFLSAPLIGALSDIWGRKFFLLITVFFTCAPIPLMTINTWWFFAMISISGIFAVTFSVVFAYVADVTTIEERSKAYGLVSATFAASLVISPALGAALMESYGDTLVVALATAIAVLDVFFILVAVPESLPEKVRPSSWGAPISWEQADPFAALRKVGTDHTVLMQCVTVLLSYLPEAGQYSCIFVYLKLKMGFNTMEVAIFIAVVGILSIFIQVTLGYLMRVIGPKRTIILGLVLEMLQLVWYGFGNVKWMMWAAGVLAALGSITYPAISAFVSIHSNADRQGAVQGMVTGMRGLCNGLGPAMFGVIFYLFNVDLNTDQINTAGAEPNQNHTSNNVKFAQLVPGPPFLFGALMVVLAILVAIFIPDGRGKDVNLSRAPSEKKRASVDVQYEIEGGHKTTSPLSPLMRADSLAQL